MLQTWRWPFRRRGGHLLTPMFEHGLVHDPVSLNGNAVNGSTVNGHTVNDTECAYKFIPCIGKLR